MPGDPRADALETFLACLPIAASYVVARMSRRDEPRRRLLDELRLILAARLRHCADDLEHKVRALDDRRAGARRATDDEPE